MSITCSCTVSARIKRKIVGDKKCDLIKRYSISAEEVQVKDVKNSVYN